MQNKNTDNMIHHLQKEDKTIILIGTAHVSRKSVQLVQEVIAKEKPDTVSIELCQSRYTAIRHKDRWREMDIIKIIREKKAFLLLSNLILASFQKRIASKLNVKPGEEMLEAINSAEAVGAKIHLADRDIQTTLSRIWRSMGLWAKLKLMFQLILSIGETDEIEEIDIEKMKEQDVLEAILTDVGKSLPILKEILITERDRYLSHRIKMAPGKKIVAVVGAGHVPGIKKYWDSDIDIDALEKLPPKNKLMASLKYLLPAAIVILIGAGFFYGGKGAGSDMIFWWVAANGILAGIGALIALGHPFTILSSVLAAPLTSLNPMIAAGWVSGLVEAFSRKPKVRDLESLSTDILSIKGFWHNKVTRILLVVVFTNLGSMLGTFVAIPIMIKLIH